MTIEQGTKQITERLQVWPEPLRRSGNLTECRFVARIESPAGSYDIGEVAFDVLGATNLDALNGLDRAEAEFTLEHLDGMITRHGWVRDDNGLVWNRRSYTRPFDPARVEAPLVSSSPRYRADKGPRWHMQAPLSIFGRSPFDARRIRWGGGLGLILGILSLLTAQDSFAMVMGFLLIGFSILMWALTAFGTKPFRTLSPGAKGVVGVSAITVVSIVYLFFACFFLTLWIIKVVTGRN